MTKGGTEKLLVKIDRPRLRAVVWWALVLGVIALIATNIRPRADSLADLSGFTDFGGNGSADAPPLNETVDVQPNGYIKIDGRLIKETVRRVQDADEVRLEIITASPSYVPTVTITLNLPAPITGDNQVLAIHGGTAAPVQKITPQQTVYLINDLEPGASVSIIAQMDRGALRLAPKVWFASLALATPIWVWWLFAALLPLLTFIIIRLIFIRRTRVPLINTQLAEPPSNLPAAAAGLLIDSKIGKRQLAAILVNLAVRGDIQLVQTRYGYKIARRRALTNLTEAEKFLVSELRLKLGAINEQDKIEEESQKQLFSRHITEAYLSIYNELESRGFFYANPGEQKVTFRFLGLLIIVLSVAATVASQLLIPEGLNLLPAFVGLFISGWLVLILAPHLPHLTSIGAHEKEKWLAFKRYLSDPQTLSGDQSLAKIFEQYLPYAISFGVADLWLGRFKAELMHIPEWYFNEENPGSTEIFAADVGHITDNVGQTLSVAALPHT